VDIILAPERRGHEGVDGDVLILISFVCMILIRFERVQDSSYDQDCQPVREDDFKNVHSTYSLSCTSSYDVDVHDHDYSRTQTQNSIHS
jgi:hypothetical protein